MNVRLTPELERFVQAQVTSGRYASVDDALNAAVALLQTDDQLPDDLDKLRSIVDVGLAEADAGQFVEFTAEDVITERRAAYEARHAKRKGA